MIIVRLSGGIGNQLFQYAFGKALSLEHGVDLKVDPRGIAGHIGFTDREQDLFHFVKDLKVADPAELKRYSRSKFGKAIDLLFMYLNMHRPGMYVREPHFHFSKTMLNAPSECYLDGYWQSEKYFMKYGVQIRQELTETMRFSEESKKAAAAIGSQNSVSVHVRRGDYLNSVNSKIYEMPGKNYYDPAMEYMMEHMEKPVFFIFSDDPDVEIKTDTAPVVRVDHNKGKDSYQDLLLMSLCKHNIIANSSFSWWGAWLNANSEKIVIAPEKWFKGNSKNTKDLIPSNWIKR